jgi:hypothetical protein
MVLRTKLDSPDSSGRRSNTMTLRTAGSVSSARHHGIASKWATGSATGWLWLSGAECALTAGFAGEDFFLFFFFLSFFSVFYTPVDTSRVSSPVRRLLLFKFLPK